MVFVQGEQVVIQGLVSRSDLNGKHMCWAPQSTGACMSQSIKVESQP